MGTFHTRIVPLESIRRLGIEITTRCNTSCPFCPRNKAIPHEDMPFETVLKVLEKFVIGCSKMGMKLRLVNITEFGETTLYDHNRLIDIIKYCGEIGLQTRISTNASLLNKELSIGLLKAGLSQINISVDACDRKTYEKIRPGLDWHTVLNNSISFYKLKKSGKYRTRVTIYAVECEENKGQMRRIINFWRNYSDSCHPNKEVPLVDNRVPNWTLNVKQQFIRRFIGSLGYWSPTYCHDWTIVRIDGTVVPCCLDYFSEMPLGNIFKESVPEIFYGHSVSAFRQSVMYGTPSPLCSKCMFLPMIKRVKWNLW